MHYVHAQPSDFINSITPSSGDIFNGRHVQRLASPVSDGIEGYYKSGFNIDGDLAFVSRVDDFGNPLWTRRIPNITSDRMVMAISTAAMNNVFVGVQEDDFFVIHAFEQDGSPVGGVFPLRVDYPEILPTEMKEVGSNIVGLAVDPNGSEDLVMTSVEPDGGSVIFTNSYRAFNISRQALSASFVEQSSGDILVVYGTHSEASQIVTFEVNPVAGNILPAGLPELFYNNVNGPAPLHDWREVDVHDVVEIGTTGEFVVSGNFGWDAMLAKLDVNLEVEFADIVTQTFPRDFNPILKLQHLTGVNMQAAGISTWDINANEPGVLFVYEFDIGGTSFINLNKHEVTTGSPSFDGFTAYPMSFGEPPNGEVTLTCDTYSPSGGGLPLIALTGLNLSNCSLFQPTLVQQALTDISLQNSDAVEDGVGATILTPVNNPEPVTSSFICNNPCPTPGGTLDIDYEGCFFSGTNLTLEASHTGIATPHYIWAPNGETTQSINVTSAGTYTVTVYDAATGCVYIESIDVEDNGLSGWHQYSESHSSGYATVVDVESDPTGNIYVMGTFENDVDILVNPQLDPGDKVTINPGSSSHTGMYITKYNNCGVLDWVAFSKVDPNGQQEHIEGVDIEFRDNELRMLFYTADEMTGTFLPEIEVLDKTSTGIRFGSGNFESLSASSGNYMVGSLEELPNGNVTVNDLNPVDIALTTGNNDEFTSIEYIAGDYFVAGRHAGGAYITQLIFGSIGLLTTYEEDPSNHYQESPNNDEIINDIEHYEFMIGNPHIYVTGKYEQANFFNGTLPAAPGDYDVFIGALDYTALPAGFNNLGGVFNNWASAQTSAEGIELDYMESLTHEYDIFVTGVYEDDLNDWGLTATISARNAFVAKIVDDGSSLDHEWTYTFNGGSGTGFNSATGTSVIIEQTIPRLYAAGEAVSDVLEEYNGSTDVTLNSVGVEMWVAEIELPGGPGLWLAAGKSGDNNVRGIAAHDNQAFVGGYSSNDIELIPNVTSWPVSPIIPTGFNNNWDLFVARIGDFPGSGSGQFYKRDPDDLTESNDDFWSEPETAPHKVNIMPNPTSGNIQVELISPDNESWQIEVYNSTGSLVLATEQISGNTGIYQGNWSNLSSGLYLLKINQGAFVTTKRLVIR